jgi:hypothetical protein
VQVIALVPNDSGFHDVQLGARNGQYAPLGLLTDSVSVCGGVPTHAGCPPMLADTRPSLEGRVHHHSPARNPCRFESASKWPIAARSRRR